ncbi:MAG TPA: hypothetical protein VFO55_01445, partial [Gemmatimonadaceae bacterium]|nr:hypothetical protein [Gemmatimonadaceae bacterium]
MAGHRLLIALALLSVGAPPLAGQSAAAACAITSEHYANQVVRTFGDLRVCMLAFGADPGSAPATWPTTASRLVMETQRPSDIRRMMIGEGRVEWAVNGQTRPADSTAIAWRRAVEDLLVNEWEAVMLRAKVAALRMDIDSLPARRNRIPREIDSIARLERNLRSRIMTLESQDRNSQARIAAHEQQLRQIQAEIRRQQSLRPPDAAGRARVEAVIAQLERAYSLEDARLRSAERQRESLDAIRRARLLEGELEELRADHNIAMRKLQLRELNA